MKYSEKLKDPRWQKKRLEILSRDNFQCQCCEDSTSTLHVHHIHYSENPWEAEDEDLITLCGSCHKEWHRIYDNGYSDLIYAIVQLFEKMEHLSIQKAMNNG